MVIFSVVKTINDFLNGFNFSQNKIIIPTYP